MEAKKFKNIAKLLVSTAGVLLSSVADAQGVITVDSIAIHIVQKDLSNIIEISFENKNDSFILLNSCFDYQSNGELGGADITLMTKSGANEEIPIANFYSRKFTNCYLKIEKNKSYKEQIDLNTFFKSKISVSKIDAIKARFNLIYVKEQEIRNNVYVETEFVPFTPYPKACHDTK